MKNQALSPEILGSVAPPGATIRECLAVRGMTQVELADRTGLDKKTINLIVSGNAPITQDTAIALERIFQMKASFWLNLEAAFQACEGLKKEEEKLSAYEGWAAEFPYQSMAEAGWVSASKNLQERARNLLDFFQVANPESWNRVYGGKHLEASYRKSAALEDKLPLIAAWLRRGEILADEQKLANEFDGEIFMDSLKEIRNLTLLTDFRVIKTEIQKLCNHAGVKYAPTKELPKLGINGAMRWIGGSPLIQQSLRGKSHDVFWFTFFHEAWHVFQKQKRNLFLDADFLVGDDPTREAEADAMAAEILIPKIEYMNFIANNPKKGKLVVESFARSIGIHPGIVVGRLQRENRIPWNSGALNKLKIHLSWS